MRGGGGGGCLRELTGTGLEGGEIEARVDLIINSRSAEARVL